MLFISKYDSVADEVIKNLLSAQKRIAESGSADDLCKVTKLIFKLLKKFGYKHQNIVLRQSEDSTEHPPNGG